MTPRPLRRATFLSAVACLVAAPLLATFDRNGDGISDIWTEQYPAAGAPAADPDGDGADNRAEALAGTDPDVAAERFAATPLTDPSGNMILSWP